METGFTAPCSYEHDRVGYLLKGWMEKYKKYGHVRVLVFENQLCE